MKAKSAMCYNCRPTSQSQACRNMRSGERDKQKWPCNDIKIRNSGNPTYICSKIIIRSDLPIVCYWLWNVVTFLKDRT
jgi:hypothetical protein